MNKSKLILAILIGIIIVSIPAIYASDLPAGFDEPCPTGMSIIQEVCFVINTLHDRIEINEVNITSIFATIGVIENDISILQSNVTSITSALNVEIVATNTDINSLDSRTLALEQVTFTTYIQGFDILGFTLAEFELECPEGTILTGGGNNRIMSPGIVIDSHPQDNGWKVRINNNVAVDYGFKIYVICMTP